MIQSSSSSPILEERDDLLIIMNSQGQITTVPKTPYYLLKYKQYDGNRISYNFSETVFVKETFDDGIFNCTYGKNLVQIRDFDDVALSIQSHVDTDTLDVFDELFSKKWSEIHKEELVTWFLQEFITSGRISVKHSRYVIDGIFEVDSHGNAYALNKRDKQDDQWKSICLVSPSNLAPKEMMFKGVPTMVDVTTQSIIAKTMFCMNPNTEDHGFMVQLPPKLRRWIERGNHNAEIKLSPHERFSENRNNNNHDTKKPMKRIF